MNNTATLEKMHHLKLYGMAGAFKTALEAGWNDRFTIDELVAHLIDTEWDDRYNRKMKRLLKSARFRYQASLEQIDFTLPRNLDKNAILRFSEGNWIQQKKNIIITGPTGVGKSFIATALGHQACVLALAGITRVDPYLELWAKPESVEWAENFLRDSWLKKDQKLVAVSLSASKRWRTKNWGVSQMAELTDMLAKEKGIRVVALGVEDDSSEGEDFFKKTSAKPINAIGKTDTSRLISLIKRCDALVTGDSAPMHIASATGTPFVAMFGPTDPERHAPVSGKKKVIKKNMRCSPCYKTSCIKGVKCMTSIKVREVFDALVEVMEK